ncbi:MAG: glycoside hydrolase family 26 protein [Filifactoraceae bacterium]
MNIGRKVTSLVLAGVIFLAPTTAFSVSYGNNNTYNYESVNDSKDIFSNFVDGYSIEVPKGMEVNMTKSEVVSSLSNKNLEIQIFRQETLDGASSKSYISYGNKFINNTVDHNKEYGITTNINGRNVTILQWSRNKLSKVDNDKNHYATVDIVCNKEVYTLFFKSSVPLYSVIDYMDVIRSFKLIKKTKNSVRFNSTNPESLCWNEKTKNFYRENFLDSKSVKWGIFEPYFPSTDKLKRIENEIGSKLNYVVLYTHIKDNDLTQIQSSLDTAKNEGRTIELTLQTRPSNATEKNAVYGVLNGEYDSYLETYAKQIANYGEPILFRLGNEMNGDWCSYSAYHTSKDAQIYVEMYKYIYDKFERAGANANTIWVWNPNGKSYPNFKWNNELMYYPGDKYVNIVGMTVYNTGTYYEGEKWTSFKDLYSNLYNLYETRYAQPLIITEFASSSVGGDKVKWVEEMFNDLPSFPKIKLAIWWNGADYDSNGKVARPYFIDDIPDVLKVFKQRITN